MSRFNAVLLATTVSFAGLSPAFAQLNLTPTLPSDGFRRAPAAPTRVTPAQPVQPAPAAKPRAQAPARPAIAAVSQAVEPTYDAQTYDRLIAALQQYRLIEAQGGWPVLPASAKLGPGAAGPEVALLRRRLAITGDLPAAAAAGEAYDETVIAGVKRFQARHGLAETGSVGTQTLAELNVPVAQRLRAIHASLQRLHGSKFVFGQRYVVVNIPAAVAEAVAGGRVEKRYVAVVGKVDRPSPTVETSITSVNLNPTWTPPLSILKKDILPKARKDPNFLARMRMKVLDAQGREVSPTLIDWKSDRVPAFTIRQEQGSWNALGALRIDMPNPHAVYMHDTNHKNLFSADYRFHSSGCARIADVRDLAAWLLQDNGLGRREMDAQIATGRRIDIRLARPVPVAWVYLTAWATRDGKVHFRPDIYKHDPAPEKQFMVQLPPQVVAQVRAAGFMLQSGSTRPAEFRQVSYLDSR